MLKATYAMLCVCAVLCLLASTGQSEPYRSFHMGVRPLGMGGAFTAVADDQNAMDYNPAGLSRTEGVGVGILNPMVVASEDTYDLISDYDDIDQNDVAEVIELLKKYVGENHHITLAADVYAGFRLGNVGVMVAGVGRGGADLTIRNPVYPVLSVVSDVDYGGQAGVGYALPHVPGLSLGVGVKALNRSSIDETYTAADIADDDFEDTLDDDQVDGTDASFDLGMIWSREIEGVTRVSLGLAGINIREMDFGDARDQESQYNAGVAFTQRFFGFALTEAFDYHDITDNLTGDGSTEKKLHMGAELEFPILLALRAGLSQGYYTAGATVDFSFLRLDVATYGEEIGVYGGQKEDRRYAAQLSLGWSW
ncbi:conjugal transfer protein TraF [Desulfoluna spongiiphila]|uniref:Plasmid transfer operon, TraF, protein n=1 Tax=Desulfoluna spongiiphila TaxID=419481 RepID=A0A1G5IDS1_9BACT|nr:conjugal transfer protein TraF [Desulfoluna spongiiphila]SCY74154.1 plasmid transfer operon, TraF, protein [Desulfoluna spongiiphila]